MKRLIQYIFSVTNSLDKRHKIVSILGIKLKFKRRKNYTMEIVSEDISNFNEVKENFECPFCQSKRYYPVKSFNFSELIHEYKKVYKIDPVGERLRNKKLVKYRCSECGIEFYNYTILTPPVFYEKLLATGNYIYPEYKWEYEKAIELILKYDCRRILDVSCGSGNFLDKIQNITEYSIGTEFNSTAINECIKKGLNVTDKKLEDLDEKFDFVTAFQILEHMENPKIFIKNVLGCVTGGGYALFGTPNPEGFWIKTNPWILNLPPHHNLDITEEFYKNLEKYFDVKLMGYFQDAPDWGLYRSFVLPMHTNLSMTAQDYLCFLKEKKTMKGHNHLILLQKLH